MNRGKTRTKTTTRETFRHTAEYIAVIIFYGLLRLLPRGWRLRLATLFGHISYLVTPRRVKIARENLRTSFPQLRESERNRIVKRVYRNLACNAVEEIDLAGAARTIAVDGETELRLADLQRRCEQGEPLIFVTGHYGNWEVLAQFLAARFGRLSVLAKEQSNPYIDGMVNRLRSATGGSVILTHAAARAVPKVIRSGGILMLAGDQDAGSEGVMIDFLGRPAAYFRGWALFSYRYNVPVVIIFLRRESEGFALEIADIVEPQVSAEKDAEIRRLLYAYSDLLATAVTAYPEQWLWTHRRWKSGVASPSHN